MVALAGRAWELAPSLVAMFDEANAAAPNRVRRADGSIGDAAHQSRYSHHNPQDGFVDALDLTHSPEHGWDCAARVASIVSRQDPRVEYLIWNRQVWRSYKRKPHHPAPWVPAPYTGSNPHTFHMHVSVYRNPAGRLPTGPWWPTNDLYPLEDSMGDYARQIELAYKQAKINDPAGEAYWVKKLRTHDAGPGFIVAECRRQLGLDPIPD